LPTVPTAGESDQLTPLFVVPPTVAANCFDWPPESEAVAGEIAIVTPGGGGATPSEIAALADFVESATLVAEIVTVWADFILAGAVYRPFTIVPTCGERAHNTAVSVAPVTVAVNCWDLPAPSVADPGLKETLTFPVVAVGSRKTAVLAAPPIGDTAVMVTV